MGMKPGMRMLAAQYLTQHNEQPPRSEYGGESRRRMIGYDRDPEAVESRRSRDSRGRFMEAENWEGNTSFPRSEYDERKYGIGNDDSRMGGYAAESRTGGFATESRQRDRRGRYMMGDGYHDGAEMRSQTWYPPHNMQPMGMHPGNSYGDIYAHGSIYAPGAMNRPMGGGAHDEMSEPVDEHTARHWVKKMDGGEHFRAEQADQLRAGICPDCDRWEFYVALNAMYSDHCETAKRMNMDKPEFYAHLAKDFLKDEDAQPHKLRRYMETIAK